MLVRVVAKRQQPPWPEDILSDREVSVEKALQLLTECELGFGGQITEVSETRVVVRTLVFATVDTTIFSGTPEAMRPMLQYLRAFLQASDTITSEVMAGPVGHVTGGVPLLVTSLGVWMVGGARAKGALVACVGESEAHVEPLSKLSYADLCTLFVMRATGREAEMREYRNLILG